MGRPRTRDDNDPKVIADRARVSLWQQTNPQKANANHRRWRDANRDSAVAAERARRANKRDADPQAAKYATRVRTLRPYGLTPEQRDAKFEAQGRCCAICQTEDSGGRWHTDHDPTIGKKAVRGILCVRCNIGIGQFRHNSNVLIDAAYYIKHSRERLHPEVGLPYYLERSSGQMDLVQ